MKNRILCLGDSHGGFLAVKQVMERAKFDNNKDTLICLGDIVDGWSQSAELIQYFIDLQKESNNRHIFIKGNHDGMCNNWLTNGQAPLNWTQQGGQASINSYIKTGYITEESHREFFKNQLLYYIDDQNRAFVHGGFTSRKGIGHEPYESNYYWDRDMWSLAVMSHNSLSDMPNLVKDKMPSNLRFLRYKEIYIGHTVTENWNVKPHYPEYKDNNQAKQGKITVPMNRCNVWNLDTGGGFKGKVTLMDIDTKEYFQSNFVKELYPNELGR